jgi:hypothetical protein
MRNRVYLVLGILLVAAVVGLLWRSPWEPRQVLEPVYDGKPLSYWLADIVMRARQGRASVTVWRGSKGEPDIIRRAMSDSNAVPFLVGVLRRDRWFGAGYYRRWFWPKLPPSIRKHLPPPPAGKATTRSNAALLLGMGHDEQRAILALVGALKDDDDSVVRWNAAWALGNLGNRNRTAVAALSEALKDKDPALRNEATNVLLHLDPEGAAKAGINMSAVIAGMKEALNDTNVWVRMDATNSMLYIDPEAAAKEGVERPSP